MGDMFNTMVLVALVARAAPHPPANPKSDRPPKEHASTDTYGKRDPYPKDKP